MNYLQQVVDVTVEVRTAAMSDTSDEKHTPLSLAESSPTSASGAPVTDVPFTVIPRQPLYIHVTLSFDNTNGGKTGRATALLAQLGETSLAQAWQRLFRRVHLFPFLMERSSDPTAQKGTSPSGSSPPRSGVAPASSSSTGVQGTFVFGVPSCWGTGELNSSVDATLCGAPRPIGKVLEAVCDDIVVAPSPKGSASPIPASISSTYSFLFVMPEVEEDLLGFEASLALVLLLPLGQGSEADTAYPTSVTDDKATLIIMKVLSRSSENPFVGSLISRWFGKHTTLFGCGYCPLVVSRALLCQSVTCPLSNDRLVLSLNITNISSQPVVLHGATLDLYSTRVWRSPEAKDPTSPFPPQLWAEQRLGASGADMRTIDIMTKIVTVTPMIVSDDRPPFTLHPEEAYSFQFILEVVPQLCYLLNPKSLQYVYAQYQEKAFEEAQLTASGPSSVIVTGVLSESSVSRVTDCFGAAVSTNEVVLVLSSSYISHLFVFFDVGRSAPQGNGGLHHRLSSKWSFGA